MTDDMTGRWVADPAKAERYILALEQSLSYERQQVNRERARADGLAAELEELRVRVGERRQ